MRTKIPDYKGDHRILSLAFDEKTKEKLSSESVELLYISPEKLVIYPDQTYIFPHPTVIDFFSRCNNYDVIEIFTGGDVFRCYDNSSSENVFFITGMCNSNCIMCPSPISSRKKQHTIDIDRLMQIASHIPSDVPFITVTGGEPFMAGKELFRLLYYCREKFSETEFQILTNGRIFAVNEYCYLLKKSIPDHCILGIPIHGSNPRLHDKITQSPGSFLQTFNGLKKLQLLDIATEIRIVVCRDNIKDLCKIARLIVNQFPKVAYVSIMAMEMTGNAFLNRARVWIPYRESFHYVREAVEILIRASIDVRLYNYPLCTVDRDMRMLCCKSISNWKVRFGEVCDTCTFKSACSGVFSGTLRMECMELTPII